MLPALPLAIQAPTGGNDMQMGMVPTFGSLPWNSRFASKSFVSFNIPNIPPVEAPGANDTVYGFGLVDWCDSWFEGRLAPAPAIVRAIVPSCQLHRATVAYF